MQYVRAHRGELVFDDLGSDWGVIAPNLEVTVGKGADYRGTLRFSDGTIVIQKYEPMTADLTATLAFVDGKIVIDRIDLITDGAVSTMTRRRRSAEWPEMFYQVKSRIQFPRMREIFFARDKFSLFGEGALHRHVPSVQGRPRAEGRLLQRAGRRERLPLSRTWRARWSGCAIGSR